MKDVIHAMRKGTHHKQCMSQKQCSCLKWSVNCLERRFKNKMICGLLTEEIQEQTALWIAYRGDSRTKWSVDCLQRRFKNEMICRLLTEEIQDRETRKWLTFKRTEKIKVMCGLTTHTHTHTQTHINTEVFIPQTQGHSIAKIFFFSSPPPLNFC